MIVKQENLKKNEEKKSFCLERLKKYEFNEEKKLIIARYLTDQNHNYVHLISTLLFHYKISMFLINIKKLIC